MDECEWFGGCPRPQVAVVEHPTVGDVGICQVHLDWLTEDLGPEGQPNPTKMVPPMVAAKMRQHPALAAMLTGDDDYFDSQEEE